MKYLLSNSYKNLTKTRKQKQKQCSGFLENKDIFEDAVKIIGHNAG